MRSNSRSASQQRKARQFAPRCAPDVSAAHLTRALPQEQIRGSKHHSTGLLAVRFEFDKPHSWTVRSLCDGLRICRIILLTFHKRLHVCGWHQPHLMVECADLPSPEMGRRASHHCNHARRRLREDMKPLAPRELPSAYNAPNASSAMNRKDPLCQIQTDDANLCQ